VEVSGHAAVCTYTVQMTVCTYTVQMTVCTYTVQMTVCTHIHCTDDSMYMTVCTHIHCTDDSMYIYCTDGGRHVLYEKFTSRTIVVHSSSVAKQYILYNTHCI
jgi:hypothetical protein